MKPVLSHNSPTSSLRLLPALQNFFIIFIWSISPLSSASSLSVPCTVLHVPVFTTFLTIQPLFYLLPTVLNVLLLPSRPHFTLLHCATKSFVYYPLLHHHLLLPHDFQLSHSFFLVLVLLPLTLLFPTQIPCPLLLLPTSFLLLAQTTA